MWFWECFLRYGEPQLPSRLIEFLYRCPVRLGDVLGRAKAEAKKLADGVDLIIDVASNHEDCWLFCTEDLAFDAFGEAIQNCHKHRLLEAGRVDMRVSASTNDDGEVRVEFLNSGTTESASPGQGIALVEKRLEAFGATILRTSRPVEEWASFKFELSFFTCEVPL
jgi:hypothetical protein